VAEMRKAYRVLIRKPDGNIPLGSLDADERTILKQILKNWMI